ncbi:NAD-dependent epimerase/dehydratase family protein [Treponema phagedenis]|uniref:NAD(P)-dependent oxidoreductase n=1 Tax=Treponema phagedenis TaxID=162 RepID=A0AAE6IU64_TREPH|nr:NAD(P)-dependent oxidoreductase [Treponema phagedenis]QEJ98223.1 NAD(P)-dependent oxidoreductase [Treponema phagedenis]QEK03733.1 NAD(P)-dependent oxidoreductase [Treponema phagedenis]
MKKTVLITGASGSMGSAALKQIAETNKYNITILLREKKTNIKLAKVLKKRYREVLNVIFGDLSDFNTCEKCVRNADYIIHCAAIIPPAADHNPSQTYKSNFLATVNLINAAKASPKSAEVKFINIGTVAQYGNRTFKHPWIRTGDPLLPSPLDFYGATKTMAEREVIESGLKFWVSLRQSGVLYEKIMLNNMSDGIVFHTPWNTAIEWATAEMSGLLLKNILEKSDTETLSSEFWKKVYNIGNGKFARVTGFETLNRGFTMMGCSVKDIFKPNWNPPRNFHCGWFYDSKVLNEYLDFQHEGFEDFFKKLEKKFWYFKLGKPFRFLIRKLMIEPLLKTTNAPMYWIQSKDEKKIRAFFGSVEAFKKIPETWDEYNLLCENKNPQTGEYLDYEKIKDESLAGNLLLDHGYDETKPESSLDIKDIKKAAVFRGGKCLSSSMSVGDLYTPLKWECSCGHTFTATPYLVLKAGHWCPDCTAPPWNFDKLAKHSTFYAQVWYDDHDLDENNFYEKIVF